jgi:pilus assembly protein FimV
MSEKIDHMHQTRLGQIWVRRVVCGLALVCLPALAQAVGLGRLVVHSGLDEPLNAEIELLAPTAQELKTLTAVLAPRAYFDAAGIDRPPHLLTIKYNVSKHSDGRHVLQLVTDQALREPFLHFLLQVEWAGGRLVREFTALLDPPHWVAGKPLELEAPRPGAAPPAEKPKPVTPPVVSSEIKPPSSQPPVRDTAGPAPVLFYDEPLFGPPHLDGSDTSGAIDPFSDDAKPARAPGTEWAAHDEYGPVKKGDTLMQVVEKMRVDKGLSVEQVMLALLKANPGAFIGNNINNLKTGRILKVPERSAVESISKAPALKEVRAQYDAWQEYKLKLAGAERVVKAPDQEEKKAPAAVAKPADKKTQIEAEKKDAKTAKATKDKPAANDALLGKESGDDLLKIVRANLADEKKPADKKADVAEGKRDATTERRALSDKVATLEEAVQSKELENKELRERVGILQDQVKNTARLIEIESKELAVQQKQASDVPSPAAVPAPAPADSPPAAKTEVTKVPADKPAAVPPARKPPPPAPPVEDNGLMGFVDELTANPLILAVGLAVVVIGAALLVVYIRRRSRAKAEFAESILSGGALDTASPDTAAPAASDTSFLSDFRHGGMGTIHDTDEVDPVAEAEVYLAYGRDEQAEEILKEAVVKEPARHELKQKLLEIYHHRNDLRSFETLAEELYAALGGKGGKVWEKVEEMGRKMNPNNPMFRGGAPVAKSASEPPTAVFSPAAPKKVSAAAAAISAAFDETMSGAKPAAAAPSPASGLQDAGLSLDLGTPAANKLAPLPDLSFDLDLAATGHVGAGQLTLDEGGDFKPPGAHDTALAVEEHGADDDFISFDTEAQAGAPSAAAAAPGLDWLAEKPSAAAAAVTDKDWDETATKLDLAKAYIDMGDNEGARSILDEVIAEGSDQQKQQARDLVAQMA